MKKPKPLPAGKYTGTITKVRKKRGKSQYVMTMLVGDITLKLVLPIPGDMAVNKKDEDNANS